MTNRTILLAATLAIVAGLAPATPAACASDAAVPGCATVDDTFSDSSLLIGTLSSPVTLYTYIGKNFNQFFTGAVCPPQCHLALSFPQSAPFAPNLNAATVTLTTFTISDGFVTWTEATPNFNFSFGVPKISTDGSGNITGWDFEFVIGGNSAAMITRTNPPTVQTIDVAYNNGTGREALIQNSAGTWSSAPATPEPASLWLMALGLAAVVWRVCAR